MIYRVMDNCLTDKSKCKCCNGTGVQYSPTLRQRARCRACNGTGNWNSTDYHTKRYPGVYSNHKLGL